MGNSVGNELNTSLDINTNFVFFVDLWTVLSLLTGQQGVYPPTYTQVVKSANLCEFLFQVVKNISARNNRQIKGPPVLPAGCFYRATE
jgi:hypothetical protein